MLKDGRVDMFIDSIYPSMLVQHAAKSDFVLESLVDGNRAYEGLIVAAKDGGMVSLSDLDGLTLALQERYSTSGFLLPAALLVEEGFELKLVSDYRERLLAGKVGFFFSGDEENTLAMIRKGGIPAGALSSEDYDQLPGQVKDEIVVLATSIAVPRKLVSVRSGLDESLSAQVIEILLAIDDADRKKMASNNSWNWEFVDLDEQSHAGILAVNEMIVKIAAVTR